MDTAGRSTFILGSAPTLYLVSTQIAHNERDFRFLNPNRPFEWTYF